MRTIYFFTAILLWIASGCTSQSDKIKADDSLTPSQKEAVKLSIIRYVSKAPDNVKGEDRFKSDYDEHYADNLRKCLLELYSVQGQYHYFLVTQPAASMIEKRHATAGRFILNDKGEVIEYEEIFRTWKMKPEVLKTKTELLFKELIAGRSLEPYYAKHTGDQYIEFPDDRTYYDKVSRSWKFKD